MTQPAKSVSGKVLSPFELRTRGFNDRVISLASSATDDADVMSRRAKELALFLLELDFGPAIVDRLTLPENVGRLSVVFCREE